MRLVICVVAILFDHGDHFYFRNETRQIVDVPVGVVALDAIAKPENLTDPEKIAQPFLDLLTREIWISVLIQKTRFAGEERARAVHFDRAAFQNHSRIKDRDFQTLGERSWHDFM